MACENEAIVYCRPVSEARQTAFGCATNIWQTAKHYPLTISTSKGIRIQYVYVGSIRCLGECQIVYKCTIHSASSRFHMRHSHSDVNPALLFRFMLFSCHMSVVVSCSVKFSVFVGLPLYFWSSLYFINNRGCFLFETKHNHCWIIVICYENFLQIVDIWLDEDFCISLWKGSPFWVYDCQNHKERPSLPKNTAYN